MIADTLRTERLTLRRPVLADLSAYAAFCASERAHYVGGPYSEAQAFDKLTAMAGQWALRGYGRYIVEYDTAAIGHVGPLHHGALDGPEMTWTLWAPEHGGQGLITQAAREVCRHVFMDAGWDEMLAEVLPDNAASVRMAERLGAELTDLPAREWYPGARIYRLSKERFS